ncbi:hypothetical protein IJ579_00515 [bacterium]|nr:hypothetical protein [bacterium]
MTKISNNQPISELPDIGMLRRSERATSPITIEFPESDSTNVQTGFYPGLSLSDKSANGGNYNFRLGERVNWIRIIDVNSVSCSFLAQVMIAAGNSSSNPTPVDNTVDNFAQKQRGDCYFLSEILAIKNTANGQEILNKNIKRNANGSVTVTLPGALAIKNNYFSRGLGSKCAITGTYTITKEALERAASFSGISYAAGDMNVVILELAMESYRAEMRETMRLLGNDASNYAFGSAQQATGNARNNDQLSGGFAFDAAFILTGQKSDVYQCTAQRYNKVKLFDDSNYRRISYQQMLAETDNSDKSKALSGYSEVTNLSGDYNYFRNMLARYSGNEDQYALTFSVRVAKNGPDGVTMAKGGHSLAVLKITDSNVYVQNPWHPDEIQVIPRKEFEQMATGFTATRMSLNEVNNNYNREMQASINNGTAPSGITQQAQTPTPVPVPTSQGIKVKKKNVQKLLNLYNENNQHPVNFETFVKHIKTLNNKIPSMTVLEKKAFNKIITKLQSTDGANFTPTDVKNIKILINKYAKLNINLSNFKF